jgi:hypothetical protein
MHGWFGCVISIRLERTRPRTGSIGLSPKQESGLLIRNGVLLYKQLIRPMMNYACPIWRSDVHTHVRMVQVLQSKCLHIATSAPWYICNRQIHEDLGVPFFSDQIRVLNYQNNNQELQREVSWCGEPLSSATGRYADGGLTQIAWSAS